MSNDAPIEGLKALAHPLRFRILGALANGERNVGEIEAISGIGQPTLSQQLATLRKTDLVTTRREAKQVYYAIDSATLGQLQQAIGTLLPPKGDVQTSAPKPARDMSGAAVFARLGS